MARPRNPFPKLCIDRTRNRAFTKVDGRFVVLGPAGSREAQAAYGKLLSNLAQHGTEQALVNRQPRETPSPVMVVEATVNELMLRFVTEESPRYSTAEQHCQKGAIRVLRELFGETPLSGFGPLKLRLARDAMLRKGWSAGFINRQAKRLRSIFRWGVSWELVPAAVAESLATLSPLPSDDRRARTAIPDADLAAVRDVLQGRNRDLFDLLLLTGARSGELLGLTTGMIDRSSEVWRADLTHHKTAHKGKLRTLFFNRTAQAILTEYLQPGDPDARLFPIRRDHYGTMVKRACEVAFGMPRELRAPDVKNLSPGELADVRRRAAAWRKANCFTPHWLRHTTATRLANELGTEAAQRLLGHASAAMTEHYSRLADRQAIEAAKSLG